MKTIQIEKLMEKLYLIQNRFNKAITYYSYDSENLPVEQTFNISAADFLSYLEFHASERFFVISERLESTGTTSDLQLASKWDKFIDLNSDRYGKLISLMLRNYNGLNNYEGHSTLTDIMGEKNSLDVMGEKNSTDTMGEKNSSDTKGAQTVTNSIGERSSTTTSDNSNMAAPFEVSTSSVANGASLSSGTESTEAATDSSTVSGYTDSHKENSYTDSHTQESYTDSHKENTYTDTHEEYKWGNLGVSTGADMIMKEQAIRTIGYPELIFVEFINQVSIY